MAGIFSAGSGFAGFTVWMAHPEGNSVSSESHSSLKCWIFKLAICNQLMICNLLKSLSIWEAFVSVCLL